MFSSAVVIVAQICDPVSMFCRTSDLLQILFLAANLNGLVRSIGKNEQDRILDSENYARLPSISDDTSHLVVSFPGSCRYPR